jgi:hypothetical protein
MPIPLLSTSVIVQAYAIPLDCIGIPSDCIGIPSDCIGIPSDCIGIPSDCIGIPSDCFGIPSDCFGIPSDCIAIALWHKLIPLGHCPLLILVTLVFMVGTRHIDENEKLRYLMVIIIMAASFNA